MKHCREVLVPASLLEATELTTSEKLVWVSVAFDKADHEKQGPRLTRLAQRVGLCRQTVAKAVCRSLALATTRVGPRLPIGLRLL